jgi:hypothetical protein
MIFLSNPIAIYTQMFKALILPGHRVAPRIRAILVVVFLPFIFPDVLVRVSMAYRHLTNVKSTF